MSYGRAIAGVVALTGALALGGCGGGGGNDINPFAPPEPPPPGLSDPNSFLLFPNPQIQTDGTAQTNTVAYAQAYYRAIDPTNTRDTLAKWMAENGFGSGTGEEITIVFGDTRDLGYGRRMTARKKPDGTYAFMVQNYLVEPAVSYAYSRVNLDAAVNQDNRWHLGTNAIEFSPFPTAPGPGIRSFAKFFTFNAVSGEREMTINMDGRGQKAMPGPCISCHGGRADPLTPPDSTGNPRFPMVANSPTGQLGDVLARLHPLEPDHFDFSTASGFTRAEQEAAIKKFNSWILCTYPIPAADPVGPADVCRPVAASNEWQGTNAAFIKAAYGGDAMPNGTYVDSYVPANWLATGQSSLYRDVVATSCRACHILRGTQAQSDIDFDSFLKFQSYADRIKAHVIDRGNMPLARIVYDAFWANSSRVNLLANFLGPTAFDAGGAVLRPGRPIADPGPNRVVPQGATTVSASMSRFANSYRWSMVSGPAGATLTNATSEQATFTTTADGTYLLQLIASGNGMDSAPAQLTVVVDNTLFPPPVAIRFSHVKTVLQGTCTACHDVGGAGGPPIVYTDIDRDGSGGAPNGTDDLWFYTEVRGRINFTDIVASPLLRKPSNNHHSGLAQPGFDTSQAPGHFDRRHYDLFVNWILNGAPM